MAVTTSVSTPVPAGGPQPGGNGTAKKDARVDVAALPFGQLLQGLTDTPSAEGNVALADWVAHQAQVAEEVPLEVVGDTDGGLLAAGAVLGLDQLQTLVGQTLRLDTQADRAQRDGTAAVTAALQQPADASIGQPAKAGETPVVALGVQPSNTAAQNAAGQALVVDAQQGQLEAAAQDAQSGVGSAQPESPESQTDTSAGKLLLQTGVWQLVSPGAAAPAATMLGQMGQWAAQWLGSAGGTGTSEKNNEAAPGQKNALGLEALLGGGSHGHRLTEQAVQASTASQNAQNNTSAPPQAHENLRFWLQGDQQRGELVLQRDGQPLRVQVQVHGNEAQVVFRSDAAEVRGLLDAGLAQLGDLLAQQGLVLTGAQVHPEAQQGQTQDAPPHWGAARAGRVLAAESAPVGADEAGTGPRWAPGQLNIYV